MHFIKKFLQIIFYILILTQPFCANAKDSKTKITKIEFSDNKKLAITLNDVAEYKLFTLAKPDRLLIEIKNAELLKKNYLPKKPDFISKITFHKNNQTLIITLFFQEKYLAKNTNFDKKNKIISCDLEPKNKDSVDYSQDDKNGLQNLIAKENKESLAPISNQENDVVNDKEKNPLNPEKEKKKVEDKIQNKPEIEENKLIIKKTPNSIVKYKIRGEKTKSSIEENKVLPNPIASEKISQPTKKPVIIIDAGHGGKDPGTIGVYARTKEKNITLSYAKELAKHLINEKKYKVYLTRDEDFFIPLDKRVAKSRRKKADLFISLHANSIIDKNISGFSIYTLSDNSSDKQAELLAQKENQADILNGIDFSGASKDIMKTLIDLSQRESKNSSARFAKFVIRDIKKADIEILQNTHRFAGFMVLTAPDMASVLIELGYLSNRREEEMLNSASYRRLIAKTLTNSINQYFKNFK
jgi:N-acetylmuramoyl-L-alanine amidase